SPLLSAQVGDLIVGPAVTWVHGEGPWPIGADRELSAGAGPAGLLRVPPSSGLDPRGGTVVSAGTVAWQADAKRRWARATAATERCTDTAEVADMAQERDLPMAIVRAGSDLADEDLPVDLTLWLRPTGWATGLQAIVGSRCSVARLNRVRKQRRVAA